MYTVFMATDREQIKREFLRRCAGWAEGTLLTCYNSDLRILFDLYADAIGDKVLKEAKNVTPRYFGRSNSGNAGTFRQKDGAFFIELNPYPFMRMQDAGMDSVTIDGQAVEHSLDSALLVFEHELTHLIEKLKYGKTGHGKRFKALAQKYFGHDPSRAVGHTMPVRKNGVLIVPGADKTQIKPGDKVRFFYKGEYLSATVRAVNKRATVIVDEDADKGGKFYVPLALLEKT